jgi:hypothetical protein
MGEVVLDLVPLAVGIVFSPLAIMALVAVLLSRRPRLSGVLFLAGWAAATTAVLALSYGFLGQLRVAQPSGAEPSVWVSILHLVLGLVLVGGGVWEYRKGRAVLRRMAAATTHAEIISAAPQLPGWLQAASGFTGIRSFLLGFGIFALNPVDLSCALIAGIDIRTAELPPGASTALLIGFGVAALIPILIPVAVVLVLGGQAEPLLARVRTWIAEHNGIINAALLLMIGTLQLQKGLSALLG